MPIDLSTGQLTNYTYPNQVPRIGDAYEEEQPTIGKAHSEEAPSPPGRPWVLQGNQWQEMDVGEQMEGQVAGQLSQAQLSPAEEMYLRSLQRGQIDVQRQVESGTIPREQGQQMLQMMGMRSQPLMIRQSQLPQLMQRMRMVQMMRQMSLQESLMQQNAVFRARTLNERIATVGGRQFLETKPGTWEPLGETAEEKAAAIEKHRTPTRPPRPTMTTGERLAEIDRFERRFRESNDRGPNQEEIQAHLNERLRMLESSSGPTSPTAPTTTAPAPTPAPVRPEAPLPNPVADQITRQMREALSEFADTPGDGPFAQAANARTRRVRETIQEAITIINAHHRTGIPRDKLPIIRAAQQIIASRLRPPAIPGATGPGAPAVAPVPVPNPADRLPSFDEQMAGSMYAS